MSGYTRVAEGCAGERGRRRYGKTYMYKLTASAVIRADSEKAGGQKRRTARIQKARRADEKGKKGRRWMDAGG